MAQTKVQLLQPNLGDVIDFDSSTLFMDGADNRVGIRNTNPQYELDVTGTVNATNFRGNISVGTIDDWITHTGDTNTKFGFPAADEFEIHAGGGPRLRITSAGKVGVNVASPNSQFQVNDTNPSIAEFYHSDGGTNDEARISLGAYSSNPPAQRGITLVGKNNGAGHDFIVNTSNSHSAGPTEKLRIKASGEVSIGTIGGNATYLAIAQNAGLDVWGDGSAYPTLRLGTEVFQTEGEDIRFGRKDHGATDIRYHSIWSKHDSAAATNWLQFRIHDAGSSPYTSQKTVLHLNALGNMGLGTTSPNHYNGYSSITLNGTTGGEIDFEDDGTLLGDVFANPGGLYLATRSAVRPIKFQTHNGSSTAERMQLTGTGQLNIGGAYTQTTFQAQITGDLLLQKAAAAYDNPLLELYASNNTAHGGSIKFTGHYGNKYELARIRSYGGNGSQNSSGGSLGFSTGDGNEKLLIQADGNISFRHSNAPTIRIDSGNSTSGSGLKLEIDGAEHFRFEPGHFEFKESSNTSKGTLLGGIVYFSNTNLYVDLTQWTMGTNWNILEVFGYVNPNSAGSGQYTDPVHLYVYRGIGWANGGIKNFVYTVAVAPPARQAFQGGSGMSGNSGISAVWCNSGTVVGNETATSTHYVRLVIPNANASHNFQKTFRILRRY